MNTTCWLPKNWADIASIAQTAECIFILIGLIYAASQLRESGQSRKLQSLREILNEIGTDDIRDARNWILSNIPPNKELTKKRLTKENEKKVHDLSVAYDRVGLMLKLGLIPEKEFFEFQGNDIEELWNRLKTTIYKSRSVRPQHCKNFEYMATIWIEKMKNSSK